MVVVVGCWLRCRLRWLVTVVYVALQVAFVTPVLPLTPLPRVLAPTFAPVLPSSVHPLALPSSQFYLPRCLTPPCPSCPDYPRSSSRFGCPVAQLPCALLAQLLAPPCAVTLPLPRSPSSRYPASCPSCCPAFPSYPVAPFHLCALCLLPRCSSFTPVAHARTGCVRVAPIAFTVAVTPVATPSSVQLPRSQFQVTCSFVRRSPQFPGCAPRGSPHAFALSSQFVARCLALRFTITLRALRFLLPLPGCARCLTRWLVTQFSYPVGSRSLRCWCAPRLAQLPTCLPRSYPVGSYLPQFLCLGCALRWCSFGSFALLRRCAFYYVRCAFGCARLRLLPCPLPLRFVTFYLPFARCLRRLRCSFAHTHTFAVRFTRSRCLFARALVADVPVRVAVDLPLHVWFAFCVYVV